MNKEQSYHPIDEQIAGYLSGNLDSKDWEELEQWLHASAENKKYFADRQEIWLATGSVYISGQFDGDEAYARFLSRQQKAMSVPNNTKRRFTLRSVWYGAAAVVLLAFVSYFSYRQGEEKIKTGFTDIIVEAPLGSKTKMYLPDGTLVWLNAGSQITYSQGFGVNERNVRLTGEGYFEVTRNEKLTFTVRTQEVNVSVLGTKFNFRNYPDDEEAVVSLVEGRVMTTNNLKASSPVQLSPDQKMLLNKRTGEMRVSEKINARNTAEWTNGYLFFDEELLPDIAKKLERNYDVKITLADSSLETFRFYGNFTKRENRIEDILDMLSSTGKIVYEINGKEIRLKARNKVVP